MLIEIASLLIINTRAIDASIDNNNLGNNNSGYNYFVPGDSRLQIEQREREAAERAEQSRREADAREKVKRSSRGSSVLEVIGEYKVWGGCVPYAWSQGMQTRGYKWAKYYPVTQTPQKFAITHEGYYGHAVVIEQDLGEEVIIRDANYIPHKITRRIIPKSLIKGYLT